VHDMTNAYGFHAMRLSDETVLLLAREGDVEASQLRRNQARFFELHGIRFQALTSRGELFAVAMEQAK